MHGRVIEEVRRRKCDAQAPAGPPNEVRPRRRRGQCENLGVASCRHELLLRRSGHRQDRKRAEAIAAVAATVEQRADPVVHFTQAIPGAVALPDIGEENQRIRVLRIQRKRLPERRFGVIVALLQNAQRRDISMDADVVRLELRGLPKTRFRSGEIALLHLSQRSLHERLDTRSQRAVTFLVAFAAAARTGRIAHEPQRQGLAHRVRCLASIRSTTSVKSRAYRSMSNSGELCLCTVSRSR